MKADPPLRDRFTIVFRRYVIATLAMHLTAIPDGGLVITRVTVRPATACLFTDVRESGGHRLNSYGISFARLVAGVWSTS
jgi:hypothetical protein